MHHPHHHLSLLIPPARPKEHPASLAEAAARVRASGRPGLLFSAGEPLALVAETGRIWDVCTGAELGGEAASGRESHIEPDAIEEAFAQVPHAPPVEAYTDPPPHLRWPEIDVRPPLEEAAYVVTEVTNSWYYSYYRLRQITHSSQVPVEEAYPWEVGQWRRDAALGIYGRDIEQLRRFTPQMLGEVLVAEDSSGREADVARYATWMDQGLVPPPVLIVTTASGRLKLASNGHRRRLAALRAGRSLLAWVSDAVRTPAFDANGDPMAAPLTFELCDPRGIERHRETIVDLVRNVYGSRRGWLPRGDVRYLHTLEKRGAGRLSGIVRQRREALASPRMSVLALRRAEALAQTLHTGQTTSSE